MPGCSTGTNHLGEHDHRRPTFEELVQGDRCAGGVAEGEGLQRVADRDRAGGESLADQDLDAVVEHVKDFGREALGRGHFHLVRLLANHDRPV
jgi:hypothetical protein